MDMIVEMTSRMIEFNKGEPALTHHLLKVHEFARAIGHLEGLDEKDQKTLEIAALMHDIGIKVCMDRYGQCTAAMQEQIGPQLARPLLEATGLEPERIDRVCYLIGHHHTYTCIDGLDYQILVEADFLVNLYEGNQGAEAKRAALANIFRTKTATRFFHALYPET